MYVRRGSQPKKNIRTGDLSVCLFMRSSPNNGDNLGGVTYVRGLQSKVENRIAALSKKLEGVAMR